MTSNQPITRREIFLNRIRPHLTEDDIEAIDTAYRFAKYGHRDQERDDGSRFFDHPRAVAWIMIAELSVVNRDMIIAALLHDAPEDSWILSWKRIETNFGQEVKTLLGLVTKDTPEYLVRLRASRNWKALLLKLCDRLHNQRTLSARKEVKQREQIDETRDDYLPLADTLVEWMPDELKNTGKLLRERLTDVWTENAKRLSIINKPASL